MNLIPLKHYIFDYTTLIPVGEHQTTVHVIEGILAGRHPHGVVLNELRLNKWKHTIRDHNWDDAFFALCLDGSLYYGGCYPSREEAEAKHLTNDLYRNLAWIIDINTARQILNVE